MVATRAEIANLVSFAFGDSPAMSNAVLAQIIAGRKTAAYAPLRDLGPGGEPMPVVGQRFVILDGEGRPGAIIEDVEVTQCTAGAFTDEFARACGADDVAEWRARQVEWINRYGGWSDDLVVVCDRFKLVEVLPR